MVWFCRWYFPSPGTDSCICSRLFSVLGVWLWFGLQLRLALVLKVSGLGLCLGLVLVGLDVCMGMKIAPVMYICQSWTESNTKHLVLGFQVFYSVLLQTTLRSITSQYLSELIQPLSDADSHRRLRSASTAEVLVPAMWRSTIGDHAFAVDGPRSWINLPVDQRLCRTFITFKTHLQSHLFNLSFPSVWLYHWLFLYRALEAACAAYASLNLSLLHYITLHYFLWATLWLCKESGALNFMWPNETFM